MFYRTVEEKESAGLGLIISSHLCLDRINVGVVTIAKGSGHTRNSALNCIHGRPSRGPPSLNPTKGCKAARRRYNPLYKSLKTT